MAHPPAPGTRDRHRDGRPPRATRIGATSTEITFQVGGKSYSFHPSVLKSLDIGRLALGAKLSVAYDPDDPTSADLAEPWWMYAPPVIVTALYAVFLYITFLA